MKNKHWTVLFIADGMLASSEDFLTFEPDYNQIAELICFSSDFNLFLKCGC